MNINLRKEVKSSANGETEEREERKKEHSIILFRSHTVPHASNIMPLSTSTFGAWRTGGYAVRIEYVAITDSPNSQCFLSSLLH